MTQNNSAPNLSCFRRKPDNWLEFPPLASSLQTVETALMLIMMGRYPSALIDCVCATESAIKAAFNIKQNDMIDLKNLVLMACNKSSEINHRKRDFDKLRHARNRMIHYGYSPRDDAESARYLLSTGFDFLETCYKSLFNYDLMDGLVLEISSSLRVGLDTYKITKQEQIDHTYCFIPLYSALRLYFQPTFKPDWEYDLAERGHSNGVAFDLIHENTKKIESLFRNSWGFCCPICDHTNLIAEIDDAALDTRTIKLNRVVCCKCDLIIPFGCPELANILLKDEIEKNQEIILNGYGL